MDRLKKLVKKIYAATPESTKKVVSLFVRSLLRPSEKLKAVLTFDAPFRVRLSRDRSFQIWHTGKWIENDLFWHGIGKYEKVSMRLWMAAAEHAQVIFDIGANTGVFSLAAQTINPGAKVIAFEPFPRFHDQLQKNVKLNKYEIICERAAISDVKGVAEFYFPEEGAGNIYSASLSEAHYKDHNSSRSEKILVDVINLKSYIETMDVKAIDLIKIDAEGNDVNVLRGMGDYLNKFAPDILIEVHSDEVGREIQSLLNEKYYVYYNIDENRGASREKNITKSKGLNYFVCKRETAVKLKLRISWNIDSADS